MSVERPRWLTSPSSEVAQMRAHRLRPTPSFLFFFFRESRRNKPCFKRVPLPAPTRNAPKRCSVAHASHFVISSASIPSHANRLPSLSEIRTPVQRGRLDGCVVFDEKDGPGMARGLSAGARASLPGNARSCWARRQARISAGTQDVCLPGRTRSHVLEIGKQQQTADAA